jgi:hypothetical protein
VIENDNNKLASYRFLKEKTEEKKKKKNVVHGLWTDVRRQGRRPMAGCVALEG